MSTVEFLGKVALFKHVKQEEMEKLAAQVRIIYLPEGHIIRDAIRDSAAVDGLYIIKSGVAKVTSRGVGDPSGGSLLR